MASNVYGHASAEEAEVFDKTAKYLAKQDLGMSAAKTLDVEKEALMDLSKGLVFKWERRQINRRCGYVRHISMQRERV